MTERENNWYNIGTLLLNVVVATLLIVLGNMLYQERAELAKERERVRSDARREVRQLNKLIKWNEEVQVERHKAEVKTQFAKEHEK